MKMLLTSSGITNVSIREALVGLLGKPLEESSALYVPTGIYPFSVGPQHAYMVISGKHQSHLCDQGWKSMGVFELTALPSLRDDSWKPVIEQTDVLIVGGGHPAFITYWMRKSGLADMLPTLDNLVYLGVSAGAITVTPVNTDAESNLTTLPEGSDIARDIDRCLGIVDFAIYPHLNHPEMTDATLENIERWASRIPVPVYAIDDDTAIRVVDGTADVISEGEWKRIEPQTASSSPTP